mgnify:FL=1
MFLGEVDNQSSSIESICNKYIEEMDDFKQVIYEFTSQDSLNGKAYTSAKEYFKQVYIPLANGIILASEAIIEANRKFPESFRAEVDVNDVIEDLLKVQINRLNQMIIAFTNFEEITPSVKLITNSLRTLQIKFENKLQRLYEFNSKSLSIFTEAQHLLRQVESGVAEISADKGWHRSTNTFSTSLMNLDWSKEISASWDKRIKNLEAEAIAYMDTLVTKLPHVSEDEIHQLFQITKDVQHVEIPEQLTEYIMSDNHGITENFISTFKSNAVGTVLEASGTQVKNIAQLVMYYSATWGPDGPNSFVMVPTETAKRTSQAIAAGNTLTNIGKIGVPLIGGVIDFKTQVAQGEDVGDAAIKAGAHVAIGVAGGKAGAAVRAAVGSVVPGAGTAVGAAVGFVAGVAITAVGNYVFDNIYDNREAIYQGAKDIVNAGVEKLNDIGEEIGKGLKNVGNAISGFVSGLGTVFG